MPPTDQRIIACAHLTANLRALKADASSGGREPGLDVALWTMARVPTETMALSKGERQSHHNPSVNPILWIIM